MKVYEYTYAPPSVGSACCQRGASIVLPNSRALLPSLCFVSTANQRSILINRSTHKGLAAIIWNLERITSCIGSLGTRIDRIESSVAPQASGGAGAADGIANVTASSYAQPNFYPQQQQQQQQQQQGLYQQHGQQHTYRSTVEDTLVSSTIGAELASLTGLAAELRIMVQGIDSRMASNPPIRLCWGALMGCAVMPAPVASRRHNLAMPFRQRVLVFSMYLLLTHNPQSH